ncbi:hypothetical protein D3C79_682200 [compost metagenome]
MSGEQLQVDEHANTDEKQPQKNVPEGADIRFDLMAIVALAQQHASQEGTQRRRQAQQVGQPGGQQDNDQCQQYEQFCRMRAGHFVEQSRQ